MPAVIPAPLELAGLLTGNQVGPQDHAAGVRTGWVVGECRVTTTSRWVLCGASQSRPHRSIRHIGWTAPVATPTMWSVRLGPARAPEPTPGRMRRRSPDGSV